MSPTYTLTPSAATIGEGAVLTTVVSTTSVASGTTLYYSLSGDGITSGDFSAGSLTGSGSVGSNGQFSFSHTLNNDLRAEGTETLQIKLFSNSARTTQVGTTASAAIADTSTGGLPTYTFTTDRTTVNETVDNGGWQVIRTTVRTTNVPSSSILYFSLSGTGITADDFSYGTFFTSSYGVIGTQVFTGSAQVGGDGRSSEFSFYHIIANDRRTEGAETLEIKFFSDSARTTQVGQLHR